ncbi:hypothetical protein B0H67DRAFT_259942 [Lasiosphaeris hirsuta]|uniref:Uncharacterized protein n=1 Tax=Lasiosphaeris hirsuta TaxID=260670 RepID=A0AA40AI28_9PEZI|nr:hypothetical protein B0H67DRAFT_259942 [Lasiosphaeris hirsuta]
MAVASTPYPSPPRYPGPKGGGRRLTTVSQLGISRLPDCQPPSRPLTLPTGAAVAGASSLGKNGMIMTLGLEGCGAGGCHSGRVLAFDSVSRPLIGTPRLETSLQDLLQARQAGVQPDLFSKPPPPSSPPPPPPGLVENMVHPGRHDARHGRMQRGSSECGSGLLVLEARLGPISGRLTIQDVDALSWDALRSGSGQRELDLRCSPNVACYRSEGWVGWR